MYDFFYLITSLSIEDSLQQILKKITGKHQRKKIAGKTTWSKRQKSSGVIKASASGLISSRSAEHLSAVATSILALISRGFSTQQRQGSPPQIARAALIISHGRGGRAQSFLFGAAPSPLARTQGALKWTYLRCRVAADSSLHFQ